MFNYLRFIKNQVNKNRELSIIIVFCLGLLFVITNKPVQLFENFGFNKCPNILIQKDKFIYLYNSRLAKIPGVNPVRFNNLEDYVEYTKWQQSQNINCPILFFTTFI